MINSKIQYKMTPERVAIITEALSNGLTQKEASLLAGINEDTLCNWKRSNSDFSDKVAKSVIEYKQTLMETIRKAGAKDWKACAWLLERKYKKEFSTETFFEKDHLEEFPEFSFDHQRIAEEVIRKL